MAFLFADRVKETTTDTGTGTIDLDGAVTGFQGFVAGIGNGNSCFYGMENGTDWEIGLGTVTDASPDTLSRDTILASSNGGSAVNWGAGTKNVYVTVPADRIGPTVLDNTQPTTDVGDITVTGLSSHRVVQIVGTLQPTSSSKLTIRCRASGGTWRDLGDHGSTVGGGHAMPFEVWLTNVNQAEEKTVVVRVGDVNAGLDSSDAIQSTTSTPTSFVWVSYDEIWDEVEVSMSGGNIEGSTADDRGRCLTLGY